MKLGDAVAKVAQPIARFIDFILGTKLEYCPGCRERRTILNEQTLWQVMGKLIRLHNPFKR